MQDIILALVQPLAEWTVRPVWRQLSYVLHYKSNIEHLNEQVLLLRDKRDGVNLDVTDARRGLKEISPGVDRWLGDVDKIIVEEETSFSEETVAAKAACYNGWLPNLNCRHSLGRKAKKMTEKVDKLLANEPRSTAHSAAPPKVEFQPTEDSTLLGTNFHEGASSSGTSIQDQPPAYDGKNINFDSRRSTIRDVMEALKGNQFNPVIICGMGGIGKTTLMGQVFEKAKEGGLFNEYTKATLKESLNKAADLCLIQDELARYLGLSLEGKETDARASMLRQRLSQGSKKILVMLDNVWTTGPDFLWDIGIPPSCQLLVTSRQQDLFKNMDTRKNFPIHGLSDRDAWSLFKKTAGSSIESDPEFHVVAKRILKECGGLLIAISTVGTALKGESIAIWKNALRELEKASPENVPGVIEHVYGKIKLSYECLPNEQAKSCLLLCCIFEESSDIPIEDLVRYGHGLGLFKGIDSMVEGRNCLETLVHTLKSRFLLLDSDQKECVRMHDVVRDVAVYIASEEFVEKKSDGFEKRIVVTDKAKTVKLMDWPNNTDSEQSAYFSSLGISGLCQLLLFRKLHVPGDSTLEPPPTIFNRMEGLKVLAIIRDFQSTLSLDSLVPSLSVLKSLQTLRLDKCRVEDVSVIGELRTLMILSLHGCWTLQQLPETFKKLSDLRLLALSECRNLNIIPAGVISSLSRLEELYMWNTYDDWVSDKLGSIETTNWISKLETSGSQDLFCFSETPVARWKMLNELAVEGAAEVVEWFRDEVEGDLKENDDHTRWANSMKWETGVLADLLSLPHLTTLEASLPPVNILLTTTLFNKLERFRIFIGWKRHLRDQKVKHVGNYLRVQNLDASAMEGSGITSLLKKTSILEFKLQNVKYLIDTTTTPHCSSTIFPVLNSLEIRQAFYLKEIFHGELPTGSLKELRSLKLSYLHRLTHIWKTNSRSECGVLRNILGVVQVLKIEHCCSLEGIVIFEYDDEEVFSFQSLTELTLVNLSNFTGISKNISEGTERLPEDSSPGQSDVIRQPLFHTKVKEIWNNQLSAESFYELKSLKVDRCDELVKKTLRDLPNLGSFSQGKYNFKWPLVKKTEIFR